MQQEIHKPNCTIGNSGSCFKMDMQTSLLTRNTSGIYFLHTSQFEAGKQSCIAACFGGTIQAELKSDKTTCNSRKTEEA